MTLIDGDRIITANLYDDEQEEYTEKKMSIIDYINAYTDEGVTTADVVEQTRWIPVSERLPEDGRPVLIYAWNVHHVIARYDEFRTANGYKKCWVTADAWNGNTVINHEVIAWMPLPKPYELQESEE